MSETARESATSPPSETKLISVILSLRNEEEVLEEMIRRLEAALDPTAYDYELIFVNDASTDRSREILEERASTDPHIRVLNTSSRFGVIPCVVAGMEHARGDALVTIDCDLQDPPEVIPEMLERWSEGADVVHATRTRRLGEPVIKLMLTKLGYRLLNAIADIDLPVDTGMFKLIDRRVVKQLLLIEEQDAYLRGLVSWVGFRQEQIYYQREARFAGKTHFPLFSTNPIREFSIGIISFSRLPLAAILALGLSLTAASMVALAAMLLATLSGVGVELAYYGFAVLVLLGAIQLLGLGIVGLYLGRVYRQTRGRPHYIIESAIGFDEDDANDGHSRAGGNL